MNAGNMRKLIACMQSERNPIGFDMGTWFKHNVYEYHSRDKIMDIVQSHVCGTVACIAGHAAVLAWEENPTLGGRVEDVAADWLGLDPTQEHALFMGYWEATAAGRLSLSDPRLNLEAAITELRRMVRENEEHESANPD